MAYAALQRIGMHSSLRSMVDIWVTALTLIFIAAVIVTIGIVIVRQKSQQKKSNHWLKKHGRKIDARVDRVFQNFRVKKDGKHPFVIYVKAHDPVMGQEREFESAQLFQNPDDHVVRGDFLPVYIHPTDHQNYLVDLSNIT